MDKDGQTYAVFSDFAKAFYHLCHQKLLLHQEHLLQNEQIGLRLDCYLSEAISLVKVNKTSLSVLPCVSLAFMLLLLLREFLILNHFFRSASV